MRKRVPACFLFAAATAFAAQSYAAEVSQLKDLTSVIALLALPCGEVVSATETKTKEHMAVCKDGNRYRVYLNPEGRVVAQKQ